MNQNLLMNQKFESQGSSLFKSNYLGSTCAERSSTLQKELKEDGVNINSQKIDNEIDEYDEQHLSAQFQCDLDQDFKKSLTASTQYSLVSSSFPRNSFKQQQEADCSTHIKSQKKQLITNKKTTTKQATDFSNPNLINFLNYLMQYKLFKKNSYSPKNLNIRIRRKIKNQEIKKEKKTLSLSFNSFEEYQIYCREKKIINYGYECDNCGMNPIVGPRYHCDSVACDEDFDLCQMCNKKICHEHKLEKIQKNLITRTLIQLEPFIFEGSSRQEVIYKQRREKEKESRKYGSFLF